MNLLVDTSDANSILIKIIIYIQTSNKPHLIHLADFTPRKLNTQLNMSIKQAFLVVKQDVDISARSGVYFPLTSLTFCIQRKNL